MKNYAKCLVIASITLFSGCGKSDGGGSNQGDGISGIYAVTSQTKTTEDCTGEGSPDAAAPAFYRIFPISQIFPGAAGWSSQRCTSAETCAEDTIEFGAFTFDTRSGETWSGEAVGTASGGGNCVITINVSSATKQSDGSFRIDLQVLSGKFQLSAEECDPASPIVSQKRPELVCTSRTLIATSAAK